MPVTVCVHLSRAERKEALALAGGRFPWAAMLLRSVSWAMLLTLPVVLVVLYGGRTPAFLLARRILCSPLLWGVALCCVWVSEPVRRWRLYRRSIRQGVAPQEERAFVCRISREGMVLFEAGRRTHCYTWPMVTGVVRSRRMLLAICGEELLAVLPLRCFASPRQALEAEQLMHSGVESAENESPVLLDIGPLPAVWHFDFVLTENLQRQAAKALYRGWRGSVGRHLPGLGACLLGLVVVGAFRGFLPNYVQGDTDILLLLLGLLLALVIRAIAGGRRSKGVVPTCCREGPTALEIGDDGVRVYSPFYEHRWAWREISGAESGENLALVMYRDTPLAVFPYAAAPFVQVHAALDLLEKSALGRGA